MNSKESRKAGEKSVKIKKKITKNILEACKKNNIKHNRV
jgi:hypothetical protein